MAMIALLLTLLAADEKDDALTAFAAAFKSKDVAARVQAVTELAKTQHDRVHSKLASLTLSDVREVRVAAAQGLGGAQNNLKKVTVYLTNGFLGNQADLAVEKAIIDALDQQKDGLGRQTLENIYKAGDVETAKTAINTAGEVRKKEVIGPLIAYDRLLETRAKEYQTAGPRAKGYVGQGPGNMGATVDPEAPKRAKMLSPVIHQVLYALTGMKLGTPQEWEDWWQKNGPGFKLP